MIHNLLLVSIAVLFSVMMLVMLGQKLKIAYPIFLVIAGLLISLIPGMPHIQIEPHLIFLIFLPPILFEAAWFTSWKDFHAYRKQIFSMAFGLVFITSLVVAFVSNSLIPGVTLAMGFLLGGINSPPDAVAATAILKQLKIPKRITSLLEGESLINDASSLIVFKFALAAVMTGQFIMQDAIQDFFTMSVGGIAIGALIGFLFGALLKKMPSNSNIDTVITLLVPYVLYISAEHFEFSGVLSVVTGGLIMSYNAHCYLSHNSRIQAGAVWSVLIFVMNTLIFILIGLELPVVVAAMEDYTISQGILYAIIISIVIIGVRVVYTYLLSYIPWQKSKKSMEQQDPPNWKEILVISFAAMRGVVSLAAALSIPLTLPNGEAFPHRNIILFVTFVIILITLVGQGLLLPLLLKWLDIKESGTGIPAEKQEIIVQKRLKNIALQRIQSDFSEHLEKNSLVRHQKHKLENDITMIADKNACIADTDNFQEAVKETKFILRQLIKSQRDELQQIKREKIYDDEIIRNIETQLDFDEAKITGRDH